MKKFIKISGIILLALVLVLTGLYIYLTQNAERLIRDFVTRQSQGRFSVDMKKIDLNFLQLRLSVIEPHFSSNDSINLPTTYDVRLDRLVLDLAALRPLIFQSKIYVDTLICQRPEITATKWKEKPKEKFSIPQQMGNIYTSLNKVLQNLDIKYCVIDSGHLTLVDKFNRENKPVSLTDFYVRIDNFTANAKNDTGNRYLFSDRIKFYSSRQNIITPDGNHGIRYSRLRINSLRQSIEIDSCYIYGRQPGDGFQEFGVFFDTLKLSHVDFNKLTQSQLVSADSAICMNPVITLHNEIKRKQHAASTGKRYQSRDSMEMAFKTLFGDIDIRYIGVLNADFEMQTKSGDKIISFSSKKNNFVLEDVVVIKDPSVPLHIGSLYFNVNAYEAYNTDSSYSVKFDSIIFRNRKINLANFSITPTAKNAAFFNRKNLTMRSLEMLEFNWLELIFNKKLVAREVVLVNPELSLNLAGKKPSADTSVNKSGIYSIMHKILGKINFKTLKIQDAYVDITAGTNKHFVFQRLNAEIGADKLLAANKFNEAYSAFTAVNFDGGELMIGNKTITLGKGILNGKTRSMSVSRASITDDKKSNYAVLENFSLQHIKESVPGQINVDTISWGKAEFIITPANKKEGHSPLPNTNNKGMKLTAGMVDGRNTSLKFSSPGMNADIQLDRIKMDQVNWAPGQKPTIQDLDIIGKSVRVNGPALKLTAMQFEIIHLKPSHIEQLSVRTINSKDTISITSPKWIFTPDIASVFSGKPIVGDVVINNPEIRISSTGDTSKKTANTGKTKKLPALYINHLSILHPVVTNLPPSLSKVINVNEHKSEWLFDDISTDSNRISVGAIHSSLQGISASTKNLHLKVEGEGKLQVDAGAIRYIPAAEGRDASWSAHINGISAYRIKMATNRNDTIQNNISVNSFRLENLGLKSGEKKSVHELLKNNSMLLISNGDIAVTSANSNLMVNGLQYDHSAKKLSFDTFSVQPVADRENFMKSKTWQTDYLLFNTGKTEFSGMDPELLFTDSILYVRNIESKNARLSVYKDKRLPFDFSKIKPLPVVMIGNIRKKVKIDSIRLVNTDITYEEFNEKTEMLGSVHFNRSQVLIEGIKNVDIKPTDSLRLSATTWLMDSAYIRLRFTESYTDTLHGFLFAVRMRPFNLSHLNPMLEPLVSAKIKSGRVDTIHMNSIGREYVAHGKMKMYYRGLKAQYLNKGDSSEKTLKTRLINFAANDLILHHNKKRGYGEVYAERIRERSVINYWLKMSVSGIMSNTGVKSNKRQVKRYEKSIKKLNVPEIPEVTL